MIQVGDLVRIKGHHPDLIGKLAIVIVKGTWSADVHVIDPNDNWKPRIDLRHLEKL